MLPSSLEDLRKRIRSIRRVVRQNLILPRAIRQIRELKGLARKLGGKETIRETREKRRIRLQKAIRTIKVQLRRNRLPGTVAEIKNAFIRDFEQKESERFKLLLRAVGGEGIPLASLSVCGRGTREIRYTQLLRYFLDPEEPHGLGDALLRAVIGPEILGKGFIARNINWEAAKVKAEYPLGTVRAGTRQIECIIDLMIELDNHLIMIENKIRSPESGGVSSGEITQLKRYSRALAENLPEFSSKMAIKIFLTPDGRLPKEDREWISLSYDELVRRAVEIYDEGWLTPVARGNLSCLLWDLLAGPLCFDRTMRNELRDRIEEAMKDPLYYIRLRRWCKDYFPEVKFVLKIVEACYG